MSGNYDGIKSSLMWVGLISAISFIVKGIHDHGRWSAIDDIYNKHNGWVVVPGYTDEDGNFYKDVE